MKNLHVIGITPFELPDVRMALNLQKSGFLSVLHLGRDKDKALAAMQEMAEKSTGKFGVCFVSPFSGIFPLPLSVNLVIVPYGMSIAVADGVQVFYQVHSVEEALRASREGIVKLIIKGNEGAGWVSDQSSFILFQEIAGAVRGAELWVQGGVGIHSAAALSALGASGVVLDSQLVLFSECSAPAEIKNICSKLNGNETKTISHYRVLVRPQSPALPDSPGMLDIERWLGPMDIVNGYLPLGQDIALSGAMARRYRQFSQLAFAIREACYGHLKQAKAAPAIVTDNALARDLNIRYPIAQGPMTRVSDVPAFAAAVADGGGLPFIALSLLRGEKARGLIRETRQLAGDRTWGVGILGFISPDLRDEQLQYILEEHPPVVLIAGGRPSQARRLEEAGIKVFLHVPSLSLLDLFIREGARRFVFEGRECGGHVGPLSSLVLWESQIERLQQEEDPAAFSILFAGGIHDSFSAAFVSVMTAALAIKGVKTGVLMGTAYLYTEEAVTTGAIVPQFQEQAIAHRATVLLETAPGHETRCINTSFADFFHREKQRLAMTGIDKQDLWAGLEDLNVGRLRIAAKGIARRGEELLPVGQEEQLSEGMYMIGQVVSLISRVTTVAGLHRDVAEENLRHIESAAMPLRARDENASLNIAVIGMACIYPGAKNLGEYWRNIILGKDLVTEVPDERWNKDLYFDPSSTGGEHTPSKWGGFIPRIDFDPLEFGIPPQSLAAIEPVQLLSLLVARDALRDAGYGEKEFDRENVSVIMAADGGNDLQNNYGFRCLYRQILGEMPEALDAALPSMTEDSFPGVLANVIAGRICNRLDLGGRNYSVDAACASSLAAIDLACQELQLGKAEMVLAGAADLHNSITDYLLFSSTKALSRTGRCMTFDTAADGIALGEGVAMLVLKRYDDAIRDGDRIYSIIRGSGGSSDGKSLGLTAPRKKGQWKALERAYRQAGLSPSEAGLVEAHGTGTVVGDKTELSTLSDLLIQSGAVAGQTSLGSVKTQIGHTKCAAGLAGLIKAVLAVYHGVKPPTLHLKNPNRYYRPEHNPFRFNAEAGPWLDSSRIAGVSAFGFGGTNYHVVVANDEAQVAMSGPVLSSWPAELFVFRGDIFEEARTLLTKTRNLLLSNDSIDLKDLAYSLVCYNRKTIQLSIVAEHVEDLLLKIDLALSGAAAADIFMMEKKEGKIAFLFAGQGSQRINMARELFTVFPEMRQLLRDRPGYAQVLFPHSVFDDKSLRSQKDVIKDTSFAQPLLGIVDLAIACWLRDIGIEPDMVAGHSYGELPALCFAGAFAPEELIPLSEKRAKAILDAVGEDKGIMVAVNCHAQQLNDLASAEKGIFAVNHNSPQQWVLAGTTPAMQQLMTTLKERKISFRQLEVACAFHSPLLAGAKGLYEAVLEDVVFNVPVVSVWSNTTADKYPMDPLSIRDRLSEHLVRPVRFSEEIKAMYEDGARIFIEVGPGKTLTTLTHAILGTDEGIWHSEEKTGIRHLLSLLGRYLGSGRTLQLEKLFTGRNARLLNLDDPAQTAKSTTVWLVNGHTALPASGKLPAHGAPPIVTPLKIESMSTSAADPRQSSAEKVMEEYLNSIKFMIQAQRDVLLGYLGHSPAFVPSSWPAEAKESSAIRQPWSLPERDSAAPVSPGHLANGKTAGSAAAGRTGTELAAGAAAAGPAGAENGMTGTANPAELQKMLLNIVSDKTGYPADMLGLEMDMEAELSIDSIKRIEIIGELKSRLQRIDPDMAREEGLVEKLTAVKTLGGMLEKLRGPDTGRPAEGAAATGKLVRLRFELTASHLKRSAASGLQKKTFAITDDAGGVAIAIKDILESNGASATIVSTTEALDAYEGLILLDIFDSPRRPNILESFSMIKRLDAAKTKWVFALSDFNSHLDRNADPGLLKHFQGYPGFLKSLGKEWEQARCRTIHLYTPLAAGQIAAIVLDELLHSDHLPEVIYQDTVRRTMELVPSTLATGDASDLHLDEESVVLVLGGAQGITAELMIRFAKEYPCRYVLVGRSPDPRKENAGDFALLDDKDDIRQLLVSKGEFSNPAEIEKKAQAIFKHNQILHTIRALEKDGARVEYHSLDLRNEAQLRILIDGLYEEYGRIDGVVHGAGLVEDKLFEHKTSESFERVFSTKVTPLRVLEEGLRPETQFVVLFSSVASVYGNRGQTDYAAANSVLDRYAWELKKKIKGKVIAINWGPWKGKGMVTPTLEKEYARRGISLIPLPAGMETFLNELKYGNESQILIMAE